MAGTPMNPVQLNRSVNTSLSPSYVSSFCISDIVDRLFALVHGDSRIDNSNIEFFRLCTLLSRGIDDAVDKNETPDRASDLRRLMKEVFQWQNDTSLLASIMVLMISIKGACTNGWFSEKENEELNQLFNEIATSFCSAKDMNSEDNTFHQGLSDVMLRFYPGMKMGETLVFVEATPGYGAFIKDFHITKTALSCGDKIYLVVAETDKTETSSCIISPQQVNILLNGRPVDMRTCVHKDPGPQIPTHVTHMLKYGTNLIQVVGQFSGNYIIAVAFMSMVSNPNATGLPDYVPPVAPASGLDNDIIEGTNRVSLNCPISFTRIKIPVKGHLCKHFQCFDFDNYVDINSRRPSWRCPHCSQSVCFTDIRIDQDMVKVLKECGENVSHVNISHEGLWKTFNDGDDNKDKQQDKPPLHHDSTTALNIDTNILDLTGTENDMDVTVSPQEIDKKPTPAQLQDMNLNNVHTNAVSHIDNQLQRANISTHGNWTSVNVTSQGQSQLFAPSSMQLPIHAIGSSSNTMSPVTTMSPATVTQSQSQTFGSNNMQSQQHYANNMSSGYGVRYPTTSRQVTRIPIGVQALPVQTSTRTVAGERPQGSLRYQMQQHQMMNMSSAQQSQNMGQQSQIMGQRSQNMGSQNYGHVDRSHVSSQPGQQFGSYSGVTPQQPSSHQTHMSDRFYSQQNQSFIQMINSTLSSAQLTSQVHQTGQGNHQQTHHYNMASVSQRVTQNTSWTPPVTGPLYTTPGSSVPLSQSQPQRGQGHGQGVLDASNAPGVESNWRQHSRMRGGLSGQAFEDPVNQQRVVLPTQPIQAARPRLPYLNGPRPFIPPDLQVLIENNRNGRINHDGSGGWC